MYSPVRGPFDVIFFTPRGDTILVTAVGRFRLTVLKAELKARLVSAISA